MDMLLIVSVFFLAISHSILKKKGDFEKYIGLSRVVFLSIFIKECLTMLAEYMKGLK